MDNSTPGMSKGAIVFCAITLAIQCLYVAVQPHRPWAKITDSIGWRSCPLNERADEYGGTLSLDEPVKAAASASLQPAKPKVAGAAFVPTPGLVRVMCVGDSITRGGRTVAGYRVHLYEHAKAEGLPMVMVGIPHGAPYPGNLPHCGIGGTRSDQIVSRMPGWLTAYRPDIILLEIGTNDMPRRHFAAKGEVAPVLAVNRIKWLLGTISASTNATVYVTTIPPVRDRNDYGIANSDIKTFNRGLLSAAWEAHARNPRIHPIDLYNIVRLEPSDFVSDGVHPNEAGFVKIYRAWYPIVAAAVDQMTPSAN